jgi:hypothetical protein
MGFEQVRFQNRKNLPVKINGLVRQPEFVFGHLPAISCVLVIQTKRGHMNMRLSLLALVACLGISLSAQASDIPFNVTGGTLSPSGSFTGSFLINSVGEIIDGGQFTVTAPSGGTVYTFVNNAPTSGTGGLSFFTDAGGDTFRLALNGGLNSLAFNTLLTNGTGGDTSLVLANGTTRFDATGGTITPAIPPAIPEPSSLILLSTGALGLLGAVRRRFLNA